MAEMDKKFVNLVPGTLQVEMKSDMNLFDVVNWSLDYTSNAKEGAEMKIRLKRKTKGELLTTFLPTILLTMITFATSFFKPFFFEAALSVNLTTMLVMTTIFISKMDGLPPTSAIKMIDIWLILCQLVPFCEVVLLTAIEYNSKGEQGKNGKKTKTINHHGEMRVVNLEDESKAGKEGAANEKPVSAWRPLQKDGNSLGVLSLKSVRKYQLQSEHSYCHKCI